MNVSASEVSQSAYCRLPEKMKPKYSVSEMKNVSGTCIDSTQKIQYQAAYVTEL